MSIMCVYTRESDLTLEKGFLLYLELKLRDLSLDFHIALTNAYILIYSIYIIFL